MKLQKFFAWVAVAIGLIYFLVPLIGTLEFSLRMRRNAYSFDAYASVFSDFGFITAFGFSMLMALLTIIFGMLLVVPTAYWVRLRLPQLRPVVEFITLMPLVIPAIVIVFGYLRLYNSSSILPLTGYNATTNILLVRSCRSIRALAEPPHAPSPAGFHGSAIHHRARSPARSGSCENACA